MRHLVENGLQHSYVDRRGLACLVVVLDGEFDLSHLGIVLDGHPDVPPFFCATDATRICDVGLDAIFCSLDSVRYALTDTDPGAAPLGEHDLIMAKNQILVLVIALVAAATHGGTAQHQANGPRPKRMQKVLH